MMQFQPLKSALPRERCHHVTSVVSYGTPQRTLEKRGRLVPVHTDRHHAIRVFALVGVSNIAGVLLVTQGRRDEFQRYLTLQS